MRKRHAQSLLEYVLLASLTITVVVMFSGSFFQKLVGQDGKHGAFGEHMNNMYQRMGVQQQ